MSFPHVRYLRNRQFARVRRGKRLLEFLAAQATRLTSTKTNTSITPAHVTEVAAFATLVMGTQPVDGETVTIGDRVYTFVDALTEGVAEGDLVTDNTNAANGSTVVIGAVTYTFQTVLTPGTANAVHVLIGADADASLLNLARAINNSGGTPGTDYDTTGTAAHPLVSSSASVTAHTITLTANDPGVAGNVATTASTSPDSHIDPEAATLTGGVDPVADEIVIGANAAADVAQLIDAINGDSDEGSEVSTGTVAHDDVTAADDSGDVLVTAAVAGTDANSIPVDTDVTDAVWSGLTLEGGVDEAFGPNCAASAHGITNGEGPYTPASTTNGLTAGTLYWVGVVDADTLGLALSREAAVRGEFVALTAANAVNIAKVVSSAGVFETLKANRIETVAGAADVDTLS